MKERYDDFRCCINVFLISFFSMIIILLPNMIQNHGLFLYAGDYTFQQIPFNFHVADYIKKCGTGWDWYTDLGSDLLVSYSFYLSGSPFFWILSVLPGMLVVYALPVMLALKTGIGALGAFCYIRRYVKGYTASFIGAFMYAFSGFQMTSLIFNHFHDVTALFPFLLLAFEMLVKENKKLFFAVMVALTALTNYFFFWGMVIFVLLYYIVKCFSNDFVFSWKNFLIILFESLIGIGMAALILFPVFLLLISADRVSDTLYGVDLVSYSDNTIVPKILQSMFLIPDPSSGGMLFKSQDNTHNWASISLYLPLFTITGVSVFLKKNKNHWASKILKICFIIALIPGLNSIFSLFNASYYARWYYMPTLIMCLVTAKALDEGYDFKYGIKIAMIGLSLLGLAFCLPNKVIKDSEKLSVILGKTQQPETELKFFTISDVPVLFWQCIAFSAVFLLVVYIYDHEREKNIDIIRKISLVLIGLTIVIFNIYINSTIQQTAFDSEKCYDSFIDYTPDLNDKGIFRITHATTNSLNNFSMLWGYMNAGCFHSIEPNESDDFYKAVQGCNRNMTSKYEEEDYPAYSLLSVKYIFNLSTGDDLNVEVKPVKLEGCSLYDKQKCYYIYKNDCFIPFGFMYEYCIDDNTLETYLDESIEENKYQYKKLAMLRALVLDEEDIVKYSDYIKPLPKNMLEGLDENTYVSDCSDRRAECCSSFEFDAKSYRAEITTDRSGLVFFSVPCSNGWTAKVNGKATDIIKAHYGLTAVAVEKGDNRIEFSYKTPGLAEGQKITFISIALLIIYVGFLVLKKEMFIIK